MDVDPEASNSTRVMLGRSMKQTCDHIISISIHDRAFSVKPRRTKPFFEWLRNPYDYCYAIMLGCSALYTDAIA